MKKRIQRPIQTRIEKPPGMPGIGRDVRGSATVELTVIAPILLIIMLLLVYMGLYLYDRTVLYADAYLAAFRAAQMTEQSNEEVYAEVGRQIADAMEGQLIALPEVDREITVTYQGVRITYSGEVSVPVIQSGSPFETWGSYAFEGEAYAARHRPVTFIRRCRLLLRLAEQNETEEAEEADESKEQDGA